MPETKRNAPGKRFSGIGFVQRILEDLKLLVQLISDYVRGRYRDVPLGSVAAVLVTGVYVLSPFDMIADWLPGLGQIDDAAVVAICLYLVEKDLQKYKLWQKRKDA